MRYETDGTTVSGVMVEHGYQLEADGVHWVYRGELGESRLAVGPLEGLLRETGSRRLRLYVRQERDRCQAK